MNIKLKTILADKNLTFKDLSDAINLSPNLLSRFANNKSLEVKLESIKNICDFLNITPNDLFGYEDKSNIFKVTDVSENYITLKVGK
jgi:DNA-binding Xre family transcriptional regulator